MFAAIQRGRVSVPDDAARQTRCRRFFGPGASGAWFILALASNASCLTMLTFLRCTPAYRVYRSFWVRRHLYKCDGAMGLGEAGPTRMRVRSPLLTEPCRHGMKVLPWATFQFCAPWLTRIGVNAHEEFASHGAHVVWRARSPRASPFYRYHALKHRLVAAHAPAGTDVVLSVVVDMCFSFSRSERLGA